jgi:glycosyltransferase involved in cell wall biosynthesis
MSRVGKRVSMDARPQRRVAMLAYTHYRSDPRVRREAEALVKAGHAVTVFCLEDDAASTMIDGVTVAGIFPARYRGGNALAYVLNYGRFCRAAAHALRWHHRQQSFDLVQVHTMPDFLVFAAASLKRDGVPLLLDIHDLMPELFESKFGLSERHPVARLLRWQERKSARFAHRCLAVHRRHGRLLAQRVGEDVTIDVIHNLPDPRWFPLAPPAECAGDSIRIVYHGTIAHRHGIEVAVRAMHRIHEQFPTTRLEVFGDGDAALAVAALIRQLDASPYIRFRPGMVPIERLVPALQGADIGVIPLLEDRFTNYMLPTKLLEYVAMGVPVICSDLLSVRDYFSEHQIRYVKPGDADDLAAALQQLLSDSRLRRQLATAARAFYERENWSGEERAYVGIVEAMIAGTAQRSAHAVDRSVA